MEIAWQTDLEVVLAAANAQQRPVLMDFSAVPS